MLAKDFTERVRQCMVWTGVRFSTSHGRVHQRVTGVTDGGSRPAREAPYCTLLCEPSLVPPPAQNKIDIIAFRQVAVE